MMIVIYKLVLSLLLGAFIGIERQMHNSQEGNKIFLGIRTFALITTFGTISGFIANTLPAFFLFLTGGILLLIICYYIFDSLYTKDYGITTEITLFFSFIIGILIAHEIFSLQLIIGMTVVLVLVLSQKEKLYSYIRLIKMRELQSFIRYAVIALVILPLLPNIGYHISDLPYGIELSNALGLPLSLVKSVELLNPFQLWLVVALITGIDLVGYILEKIIGGKKGWFLTSLVGGFISSTATTQSLAHQSKNNTATNTFVVAALVATLSSFFEHALLLLPLNILLFGRVIVVLIGMALVSGILIYFFNRRSVKKEKSQTSLPSKKELFHLYPAFKFALIFVLIKFISSLALKLFGDNGFYVAIGLGAIPGMDAALITIAQTANQTISMQTALFAFIIANAVNLLVKCVLAFTDGKKEFAIKFSMSAAIILIVGLFMIFLQTKIF